MPRLTQDPAVAAAALAAGRLAALPTETVYGLAADACRPDALRRIFRVKCRPATHPVIVHVAATSELTRWAADVPASAAALAEAFWPGPLTVIVRKADWVRPEVTGGQETVALRCSAHPMFAAVLRETAGLIDAPIGLAAPSANRFGQVSPTMAPHVQEGLGRHMDADDVILDGGRCAIGVESTVVDCVGSAARIVRPGAIGIDEIGEAMRGAGIADDADRLASAGGGEGRAPGTLASHYAPNADVRVIGARGLPPQVAPSERVGLIAPDGVATPTGAVRIGSPSSAGELAYDLYSWMLAADALRCTQLLVVIPAYDPHDPLGVAVADRLARACRSA